MFLSKEATWLSQRYFSDQLFTCNNSHPCCFCHFVGSQLRSACTPAAMSASVMPTSPASASKGFSSTPLKYNTGRNLNISRSLGLVLSGSDVLSEDDTYSLLSPIYHDSFDSDSDGESEDLDSEAQHPQRTETSPTQTHSELPRRARSPLRYCQHRDTLNSLHCSVTHSAKCGRTVVVVVEVVVKAPIKCASRDGPVL